MDINNYSYTNSKSKTSSIREFSHVDMDAAVDKVTNFFGETYYAVWALYFATGDEIYEAYDDIDLAIDHFDSIVKDFQEEACNE